MIDTKGMTIRDIVHVSVKHPAVLCKFNDGMFRVGFVCYDCDKQGNNVHMVFYPESNADLNRSRHIVKAYQPLFDFDNINLQGWHGCYTDEKEPKENEKCIILVERKRSYGTRYEIHYACWDGKFSFYGYKESNELSVLGYKHIKPNGYPY